MLSNNMTLAEYEQKKTAQRKVFISEVARHCAGIDEDTFASEIYPEAVKEFESKYPKYEE